MARKPAHTRRSYDSSRRSAEAESTRRAILEAARKLLVTRGYGGMKMAEVAASAQVALDTVYASVGRKPKLVELLVETAVSGIDEAVPAEQRDYVRAIRASDDAGRKLVLYASALRAIHARLAPIVRALREAARAHPELLRLWKRIAQRRQQNMATFAENLASTGQVRRGLGQEELRDILWAMGAPEFYSLLVTDAGWAPERFEAWLGDCWQRLILAPTTADGQT